MSTRSESLIARVRDLAHEERNANGEATPLQLAALELAQEHEIVEQALRAEGEGDGESFDEILKRRWI